MIKTILPVFFSVFFSFKGGAQIISPVKTNFDLTTATIVVDQNDFELVQKAAGLLQQDIAAVTGKKIPIEHTLPGHSKHAIIIGSVSNSAFIQALAAKQRIGARVISREWEAFQVRTIEGNLVIAGSDRRGTAFGVLEVSKQIGVSPWYWWADVPVKKQAALYVHSAANLTDAPKVKYRGIFINDEAPALSNWTTEKFGGFNHKFYEKVFELLLRLKSNYIWPAMWGNAFYDDDSLNIKVADQYGIVIGTSHHEPLMRAHDEWRRYGKKQKWNYDTSKAGLDAFWRGGMQRAWNEKIVSVGMRGDGDEPMSRETATSLLERIVTDQREIIATVTGKPAEKTPQLWALYKEVQDYYEKGMRVPDDVTLLLCDDNWGNLRKLPKMNEPQRQGGYGIYYHFDYVGGPRNYKWINTNPLPRIWEQMHLAWEYNVRNIWIVNVGDIKPMEFPISFFLDYAWDPTKIGPGDLQAYSEQWAAAQFGSRQAKDIADILSKYAKYNSRRKPELLDAKTYNLESGEWKRVVDEYQRLYRKAVAVERLIPASMRDAYFQLVLHPVRAMENLYQLYYAAALNKKYATIKDPIANEYVDKVKKYYETDSLVTLDYHSRNNGKWNHLMSQTHIGYTYWQQPPVNKIPAVVYVSKDSAIASQTSQHQKQLPVGGSPRLKHPRAFVERDKYVSVEADHFTRAVNSNGITWKILPDHGRTGSAVTTFPVAAPEQQPGGGTAHLQYEITTSSIGEVKINAYFSPTLNFHGAENGLQFAISLDDETPQIISINKEDKNSISGVWNKWVGENIIIKTSTHSIRTPGKHILKYWMVNSGVVLQKLVLDFGGMPTTYLGPPQTTINP
jgi:hypothetical protein